MSEILEELRRQSFVAVKDVFENGDIDGDIELRATNSDTGNFEDIFIDEDINLARSAEATAETNLENSNGGGRTSARKAFQNSLLLLLWLMVVAAMVVAVVVPSFPNFANETEAPIAPIATSPPTIADQSPTLAPTRGPHDGNETEAPIATSPPTIANQPPTLAPTRGPHDAAFSPVEQGVISTDFYMVSAAFQDGQKIPDLFSLDGGNRSPPLQWYNIPPGTKSFALFFNNPDIPKSPHWWVHWMVINIPGRVTSFDEDAQFSDGALVLSNSFGEASYSGMQTPCNKTHTYNFMLFALDMIIHPDDLHLDLFGHKLKAEVANLMKGHKLGIAELFGNFTGTGPDCGR